MSDTCDRITDKLQDIIDKLDSDKLSKRLKMSRTIYIIAIVIVTIPYVTKIYYLNNNIDGVNKYGWPTFMYLLALIFVTICYKYFAIDGVNNLYESMVCIYKNEKSSYDDSDEKLTLEEKIDENININKDEKKMLIMIEYYVNNLDSYLLLDEFSYSQFSSNLSDKINDYINEDLCYNYECDNGNKVVDDNECNCTCDSEDNDYDGFEGEHCNEYKRHYDSKELKLMKKCTDYSNDDNNGMVKELIPITNCNKGYDSINHRKLEDIGDITEIQKKDGSKLKCIHPKYCKNTCNQIEDQWCPFGTTEYDTTEYNNELSNIGSNHIPQCRNLDNINEKCINENKYYEYYCKNKIGERKEECINHSKCDWNKTDNKCTTNVKCKNIIGKDKCNDYSYKCNWKETDNKCEEIGNSSVTPAPRPAPTPSPTPAPTPNTGKKFGTNCPGVCFNSASGVGSIEDGIISAKDVNDCESKCISRSDCKGFDFNISTSTNNCVLKRKVCNDKESPPSRNFVNSNINCKSPTPAPTPASRSVLFKIGGGCDGKWKNKTNISNNTHSDTCEDGLGQCQHYNEILDKNGNPRYGRVEEIKDNNDEALMLTGQECADACANSNSYYKYISHGNPIKNRQCNINEKCNCWCYSKEHCDRDLINTKTYKTYTINPEVDLM